MTKLFDNESDNENDHEASQNDDVISQIGNYHNLRPNKSAIINRLVDITNSASRGTARKLEQTANH